jgi:hypothetical protein
MSDANNRPLMTPTPAEGAGYLLGGSPIAKIPGPSNGPNLPTKSWLQLNASATKRSKHYAANFRFT